MEKDLLRTRLNAHLEYIYPRITNTEKQREFLIAMRELIDDKIPRPVSKNGGAEMAIDIYVELIYSDNKRFGEGRSHSNFYLEKV
jgi:hypothetical protein